MNERCATRSSRRTDRAVTDTVPSCTGDLCPLLVRVDGRDVPDLAAIKSIYAAIVAENRPKKRVLLEVLRDGLPRFVALEYEKEYDTPKAKAPK